MAAVAFATVVGSSLSGAASVDDCVSDLSYAKAVTFHHSKLSVYVEDAAPSDVLEQIAAVAGFQLKTTGQLGQITAAFRDVSLEDGLRRLVRDHELMLVEVGGDRIAGSVLRSVRRRSKGRARRW